MKLIEISDRREGSDRYCEGVCFPVIYWRFVMQF